MKSYETLSRRRRAVLLATLFGLGATGCATATTLDDVPDTTMLAEADKEAAITTLAAESLPVTIAEQTLETTSPATVHVDATTTSLVEQSNSIPEAQAPAPRLVSDAEFEFMSHQGIRSIKVDGEELLVGCGFYFIGSVDGQDTVSNITNCHSNGEELMRPFDGGPITLPQNLHFVDEGIPGQLKFAGHVGPSVMLIQTVSMPLDGHPDRCNGFRSSNQPDVIYHSDRTEATYAIDAGSVTIINLGTENRWVDLVCGKYAIRIALDDSTPEMNMFAVRHPDTNNVEISFGAVYPGIAEYIAGTVSVIHID